MDYRPIRVIGWKDKRRVWRASQGGGQNAMQDGSFGSSREENPALSEAFLPWTWRQLSEAGKGPVVVSRGQSMRRRLLLAGKSGAKS